MNDEDLKKALREEVRSIDQFNDAALKLPLRDLAELPVPSTALQPGFDSDGRPIDLHKSVWVADFLDIEERYL